MRPLITDRTTIETDWACGMRRWWYKHENGTGIVPAKEAEYLEDGKDFHADLEALVGVRDDELREWATARVDELWRNPPPDQLTLERLTRRCGCLAAQALFIEPATRERFETVAVEEEIILQRDPLWIAVTPDRVLRQRDTPQHLVVRDYKSAKSFTRNWVDYWSYATQLQTLIPAVEEEYGVRCEYAQVMGILKGENRDGRLRHPYVWGFWEKDGTMTPTYKYGLTPAPVWEYSGGIVSWVDKLGLETALSVFPFSRPVFFDGRKLTMLIRSRIDREATLTDDVIAACQVNHDIRDAIFETRFTECRPMIGAPCAYLEACHSAEVNADPLGSGLFIPRTPHHDVEGIMAKGEVGSE